MSIKQIRSSRLIINAFTKQNKPGREVVCFDYEHIRIYKSNQLYS